MQEIKQLKEEIEDESNDNIIRLTYEDLELYKNYITSKLESLNIIDQLEWISIKDLLIEVLHFSILSSTNKYEMFISVRRNKFGIGLSIYDPLIKNYKYMKEQTLEIENYDNLTNNTDALINNIFIHK